MARWGVRLFRREWRQQVLILGLLGVAVAFVTVGLAVATNAAAEGATTFVLPGAGTQIDADVAAMEAAFGPGDAFAHEKVEIPGAAQPLDVRAPYPSTATSSPSLRLSDGRLPTAAGEVALTPRTAGELSLHLGSTWDGAGAPLVVVGLVENPAQLSDEFALVAGGQLDHVDNVTVRYSRDLPRGELQRYHPPSRTPAQIEGEGATAKAAAAAVVLAMATVGLLFVGLVGTAGFSVMARRRQRAFGVLGSIGATESQLRLVTIASGAALGTAAAVGGTVMGLAAWLAFASRFETQIDHRVDRFDLPWWAIGTSMLLAVLTAVGAAWWPARAASRTSVVQALSGRPSRPQPASRFAASGTIIAGAGLVALAGADQTSPPLLVGGAAACVVGVLLFAPLAIRALAFVGRNAPVAIRVALRDLVRFQARSGAALGAATLAIGIAAAVTISAAASVTTDASAPYNLRADEIVLYLSPDAAHGGPVPDLDATHLEQRRVQVDAIASAVGSDGALELDKAIDPNGSLAILPDVTGRQTVDLVDVSTDGDRTSIRFEATLYVATPELLARYGIDFGQIDAATDVLTSRSDLAGLQLWTGKRSDPVEPVIQHVDLPRGSAEPSALITAGALARLGLEPTPAGWLLQSSHPLTSAEIGTTRQAAAAAGLVAETQGGNGSARTLGQDATAAGIVFALGVLAMTVGLIRSETANDLRVLTATGASGATRRSLAAATAGALALLAAVLGTGAAYLALVAFHRSDLHSAEPAAVPRPHDAPRRAPTRRHRCRFSPRRTRTCRRGTAAARVTPRRGRPTVRVRGSEAWDRRTGPG